VISTLDKDHTDGEHKLGNTIHDHDTKGLWSTS